VNLDELSKFTEVLAVGTAAGLVSVSVIRHNSTDRTFEFHSDGPCYQRLRNTLKGMQSGEIEDAFGWCEPLRYDEFSH